MPRPRGLRNFKGAAVQTLEVVLYEGRSWEPQYNPVTPELVTAAIESKVLSWEDVHNLLALHWRDPIVLAAHQKLLLLRLETRSAPVQ